MTTTRPIEPESSDAQELAAFYADVEAAHLQPLWQITRELLTSHPEPRAVPWLWPARTLTPLAHRAMRLIPVERGGERRVLSLVNPGLGGAPYAAGTLWGALQCLGPGETAPAHRHTPGAIRFVLSGTGVWTTVNGDACDMAPGDLVLTPSWAWHDHTGTGEDGMLWFDGLDLPMVEALDAIFFEPYPDFKQVPDEPHNRSEREFADTGERFATAGSITALDPNTSPLLVYRWADTDARLSQLAAASDEPLVSLEFVNPRTGASALPTLSCAMIRLAPARTSPTVRRTGNQVFVAFSGEGTTTIAGQRFDWQSGDMFVAPSWGPVRHESNAGADLFCLGDTSVLRALGLYREEQLPEA